MEERLLLARERIEEIKDEKEGLKEYQAFFCKVSAFIADCMTIYDRVKSGVYPELSVLENENENIYADVKKEHYEESYANYSFCTCVYGEEIGRLLCLLYAEVRSIIPMIYEQNEERFLIRMELFLEVYSYFACCLREEKILPDATRVREILYWYISDYSDVETENRIREQVVSGSGLAYEVVMNSDLSDLRYLYLYGEYITQNEIETARFLNSLSSETIERMAGVFAQGFKRGFEVAGKDMSRKKTVNIRYRVGFERVIRVAVEHFSQMGLAPVFFRAATDIFSRKSARIGYFGAIENPQFDYDHKDDMSLFLDGHLVTRRLECLTAAYEMYKTQAACFAGPACMETFGEDIYQPVAKISNPAYSESARELLLEYTAQSGMIVNAYIKREERSFTIIAFPVPAIGNRFEEIFEEIIRVNTLDATLYQQLQQTMIDVLDRAEYCVVQGAGKNRTDLKIVLAELKDAKKETKFENCVADVNIPVGEIFTSPVLKGTNGLLHVSRVFLNEYEYKDLELTVNDGVITEYNCGNFDKVEENRKFIEDNLLFHHKTLPIGEFAIGTNTTAYVVAKEYEMAEKLPILISEKMGPHFAFGDTCYSHEEDVRVYNPDGKEIIAKENDFSLMRNTDETKAYFNCHTDITIPYEEIAKVTAVFADGSLMDIIRDGKFVLKGIEALNEPFERLKG